MDHPRGNFLANSRRARDQHAAAGGRNALQGRADGVDRHRAAVQLVFVTDLLTQCFILAPQPFGFRGAVDLRLSDLPLIQNLQRRFSRAVTSILFHCLS